MANQKGKSTNEDTLNNSKATFIRYKKQIITHQLYCKNNKELNIKWQIKKERVLMKIL